MKCSFLHVLALSIQVLFIFSATDDFALTNKLAHLLNESGYDPDQVSQYLNSEFKDRDAVSFQYQGHNITIDKAAVKDMLNKIEESNINLETNPEKLAEVIFNKEDIESRYIMIEPETLTKYVAIGGGIFTTIYWLVTIITIIFMCVFCKDRR